MNKFYITSPLYYVNASPHIGHAYTQIVCDAAARFEKQLEGGDTFFMTGTDEHGEKIEQAALKAGYKAGEEKKFVDGIVPRFKELWKTLKVNYDYFIRTTDTIHKKTVEKVLQILNEKGKIYKKVYKGWFCTPCENFFSNAEVNEGVCPDCKRKLERLNEENYFFKISEYQKELIDHIKDDRIFITPDIRKNEVLSFLEKNELQDLCISRPKKRLRWGIEIPFDKNFVTYVWFDALINYISGIGYLNDRKKFDSLWPHVGHVIGKDILRHHAIYWPIMLLALGEKPPKSIFVHGWWVIGGEKMSKSKGNVVDPAYFTDKYGVDALRYFLLSAVGFGYDGTFYEKLFIDKYNNDLANDLGNLVNRTLTMVEKYFAGVVPDVEEKDIDNEIKSNTEDLPGKLADAYANMNSLSALKVVLERIGWANKYIEEKAPWKLAKEDERKLKIVIYNLVQTLAALAICLYPFIPDTAGKIWAQLGMKEKIANIKFKSNQRSRPSLWGIVTSGTQISKGQPLFPRIVSGKDE